MKNSVRSVWCVGVGLVLAGAAGGQDARSGLDLEGDVVTVMSPLRVDASRQVGPVATALSFDRSMYDVIDHAKLVHMRAFPIDGTTTVDLDLETFDVMAPNVTRVRGTAEGDVTSPDPEIVLLRGEVVGEPDSWVYLALSPMMNNGVIEMNGTTYIVSSGDPKLGNNPVVYNLTDLPEGEIDWYQYVCETVGTPADFGDQLEGLSGGGMEAPCRRADMAVETDTEFAGLFSSDPEIAENMANAYIATLMGGVDTIYTNEWNMRIRIVYTRVWPDPSVPDPWENPTTVDELFVLQGLWTPTGAPYSGEWNGVHLLSGRPLGGGVAFLNAICNKEISHAVSGNLNGFFPTPIVDNDSQNWDLVVTSHEWGHNFGAPHTHGLLPVVDACGFGDCSQAENGTIMSYCHLCPGGLANIALHFAPRILDEGIIPYVTLSMPCNLDLFSLAECQGGSDCPADTNGDGVLTTADFTAWIIAYNAGDLAADANRNGTLEPADFSAWLQSWQTGCDDGGG